MDDSPSTTSVFWDFGVCTWRAQLTCRWDSVRCSPNSSSSYFHGHWLVGWEQKIWKKCVLSIAQTTTTGLVRFRFRRNCYRYVMGQGTIQLPVLQTISFTATKHNTLWHDLCYREMSSWQARLLLVEKGRSLLNATTAYAHPRPHGTLRWKVIKCRKCVHRERIFFVLCFSVCNLHDASIICTCKMRRLKELIIFEEIWLTSDHWWKAYQGCRN